MSKTLVVVESPAKAKTIEKYLGGDYAVRASYGHIRDLPKSDLGVDVDHGFEVSYEVPEDSKKHLAAVSKALKANADLILATDYDREGEAIAFHVASLLGVDPEHAKRVTFTEITRDAILEAFRRPREIDLKLFDAQEARRVLDRLVGYKISPLLWRRVQRWRSGGRRESVVAPGARPYGRLQDLAAALAAGPAWALGRARAVGGAADDRRARTRDPRLHPGRALERRRPPHPA